MSLGPKTVGKQPGGGARWGVGGTGKLGAGSSGKNVELLGGTGRGGGRASSGEEWGSMVTSENQQPLGLALTG